jgi:hypothetical protein
MVRFRVEKNRIKRGKGKTKSPIPNPNQKEWPRAYLGPAIAGSDLVGVREGDPTLVGANPRVDQLQAPGLGRRNVTARRWRAHPQVSVAHR